MHEPVTLLQPDEPPPGGTSAWALRPELLEQGRSRLAPLAIFMLVAFAFDPVLVLAGYGMASAGYPLQTGSAGSPGFLTAYLGAVAAPAAIWG